MGQWVFRFLGVMLLGCGFSFGGTAPMPGGVSSGVLPEPLKNVGIVEKSGTQVPIQDLRFAAEDGTQVQFAEFFKQGRPILLNLVYFDCPHLCTLVLNGLIKSLNEAEWSVGREFELVTVSIDPREGPALASQKKQAYLNEYRRAAPGSAARQLAEKGWHFLTGQEDQLRKLADAVGFGYKYDEKTKQFAHGAGLFILTPGGKLSRVLYGVEYSKRDFRLGLVEGAEGKVGSVIDRVMLFCYRYDPGLRSYSVYLTRILQVASALFVALIGLLIGGLLLQSRKDSRQAPSAS